jgi:hypothetical protein
LADARRLAQRDFRQQAILEGGMQHSEATTVTGIAAHTHPTMRWSAIIAGWLVATGIASLMYVAGLALGFTAFDPYNAEATAKGIGTGTAVWMVLTWAVSLFLGAMFASWFDGGSDQTVGTLHGVTVWGLSVAASGLLIAVGLMQGAQGGAAIVRGGATGGAPAAGMAWPQMTPRGPASGPTADAITGLQAQLTQRVAQTTARGTAPQLAAPTPGPQSLATAGNTGAIAAGVQPSGQSPPADLRRATDQLDRQSMAQVASALIRGKTENAKALLAANTSMSQAEIDQTLQSLSTQVEKYKADAQAAADAAARYAATAMWIVFFSSLIALVAAGIGGWMGAGHIHRVHHLRRYETTTSRPL